MDRLSKATTIARELWHEMSTDDVGTYAASLSYRFHGTRDPLPRKQMLTALCVIGSPPRGCDRKRSRAKGRQRVAHGGSVSTTRLKSGPK